MASERDLELVDQYLGNRLTTQEKSSFEKRLETDTELRNEFSLQQKVVDNIRKARVAELKNLLNNVPVSSLPSEGTSIIAKIGLWFAVAAVVGTGLYFYLNPKDDSLPPTTMEAVKEVTPSITEPAKGGEPKQEIVAAPKPEETDKQNTVEKSQKSAPVVQEPHEEPVAPAALDVFDPTDESAKAGEIETSRNKGKETTRPSILVETLTDSKYNFHYQFKDNKLYLYGSFEKNLYEILEFFSDNKHTMFLYYKEGYYLLNQEDAKVKPLAPIKDPTLLEKLRDYRKN